MGRAQTDHPMRTCAGCGAEFPRDWHQPLKKYCNVRCWTKNGTYGSARVGKLGDQRPEIQPFLTKG